MKLRAFIRVIVKTYIIIRYVILLKCVSKFLKTKIIGIHVRMTLINIAQISIINFLFYLVILTRIV